MVKNNNNKVNNYINIVNDLKDLGIIKRRKRRRSNNEPSQQRQAIIKTIPQGISGIERTIIDNSPQLRRDVQQLANERSLLGGKLMENESKLKFTFVFLKGSIDFFNFNTACLPNKLFDHGRTAT